MNIPPYPDTLKNKNWQKEKSIIAKVLPGKKTGIGEAMEECERNHATLTHELSSVAAAANMTKGAKDAAAVFGLSMLNLKSVAQDAATKWSAKTSPVPKATRIHAEQIAHDAGQHYNAMKALLGLH